MPKVWNLGNTTVRNPNRIEEGLKLFSDEFQGRVHVVRQRLDFGAGWVKKE